MHERIAAFFAELEKCWMAIPRPIQVVGYIFISAVLAQVVIQLTAVKVDNVLLSGLINVILVTIREAQKQKGVNNP